MYKRLEVIEKDTKKLLNLSYDLVTKQELTKQLSDKVTKLQLQTSLPNMEEFSKMIRDEFQAKDTEIDDKLMYGLK